MKNVKALGKRTAKTPSYATKDASKMNQPNRNAAGPNGETPKKVYKTLAFQLQSNFDDVADPEKRAFLAKKYAKGLKSMIYGNLTETTGRYNTGRN